MRFAKSFTIEPDLIRYVEGIKGNISASERINQLLRRAMIQEKHQRLEAEATEFFASAQADPHEAKSFQEAALRTFSRD